MIKNLLLIFMLSIAQIQIVWANYDGYLIQATKDGNLNKVKSLISKGANMNATKWGWNALIWASYEGHFKIAKYLISKGADVNVKDDFFGNTALMNASLNGHFELVKFLVSKGANVNAKNKSGLTALNKAKTSEIKQFLINNGARE